VVAASPHKAAAPTGPDAAAEHLEAVAFLVAEQSVSTLMYAIDHPACERLGPGNTRFGRFDPSLRKPGWCLRRTRL
jgi:hypothetical protein